MAYTKDPVYVHMVKRCFKLHVNERRLPRTLCNITAVECDRVTAYEEQILWAMDPCVDCLNLLTHKETEI